MHINNLQKFKKYIDINKFVEIDKSTTEDEDIYKYKCKHCEDGVIIFVDDYMIGFKDMVLYPCNKCKIDIGYKN